MRSIEKKDGSTLGGNVINNLRYADDTVVIAETETNLQQLMPSWCKKAKLKACI